METSGDSAPARTGRRPGPAELDLQSQASYLESCRRLADEHFAGLSLAEVEAVSRDYNAYPHLEDLEAPRNLMVLEDRLDGRLQDQARRAVLDGLVFWEHAAAGEAVRLNMGPKCLIRPHRLPEARAAGRDLLPLTLGARHLGQLIFEIRALAEEAGLDPGRVLARQKMLLVVNEASQKEIQARLLKSAFLGLPPENFLLLAQRAFPGLSPRDGRWRFDPRTARRLHNHGQMAMQKTMDRQVYHLDAAGRVRRLSQAAYFGLLDEAADLVSYNIEDLGYLTRALDFGTLGLALALGEKGYGMSMEIVANNPERPIKGGLCAYDPRLGRDVVVESFRLRDRPPEKISHLNKNFNHYPRPGRVFRELHEKGLFMPVAVKYDRPPAPGGGGGPSPGGLYYQPVQGDLNFLVETAFFTRRTPAPVRAWKEPADSPAALAAMALQDAQPGFRDFAQKNLRFEVH
ncbi:MAG: hypothetical protein LBP33_09660 [Candidatus Adiutrix sp.]|jgi:hypothetical protein|nr:hypothetical protein [Candidatus Adiutrix sp.]